MSRAQILFAVALSAVSVVIAAVGAYVVSSTTWGGRWYRTGPRSGRGPGTGRPPREQG